MDEEILVSVSAGSTRVALLAGGVVQELHVECADRPSLVGSLYVGRARRIVPGMESAFIDIGIGVNGFLTAADLPGAGAIGEQLCAGQSLLVQVTRDALRLAARWRRIASSRGPCSAGAAWKRSSAPRWLHWCLCPPAAIWLSNAPQP